jgi:hypothetical protein
VRVETRLIRCGRSARGAATDGSRIMDRLDQNPKTAAKVQQAAGSCKSRLYSSNWSRWCVWRESNAVGSPIRVRPCIATKATHSSRFCKPWLYGLNWAKWCAWRESNPLPCGPECDQALLNGGYPSSPASSECYPDPPVVPQLLQELLQTQCVIPDRPATLARRPARDGGGSARSEVEASHARTRTGGAPPVPR